MSSKPKISVIMPSLNVVKYISACMDSVLEQSLKELEILAIDAGSVDGTWEILQEYARKDKRIKLIHSEKRSYGYQVNQGIELAKGEYIGIVETDDILIHDAYEKLFEKASSLDLDYVKGYPELFWSVSDKADFRKSMPIFDKKDSMMGKVISPQNHPELLIKDIYLWQGIYKRELLRDIRLNETSGAAFQDQGFLLQTISRANCAMYIDKVVYLYRQDNRNSSIYNTKGFKYLVSEYGLNKKYLEILEKEWEHMFYTRLLNQCLGRFENMALYGEFWKDALPEMEELKELLCIAIRDKCFFVDMLPKERKMLLELFLEDPRVVYGFYLGCFKGARDVVEELKVLIDRKKVVIFGCGRVGKFLHVLLEGIELGCVLAFCDNNTLFCNTEIQECEVLSPERVVKKYPNALYIITGRGNEQEMCSQLYELGVLRNNIYVYTRNVDMTLLKVR